jgi:hypothetical protein
MMHTMSSWNREQWGNFLTLGMSSLVFWTMTYYMLKRTWRWDWLGRSLTVLSISLACLFTLSTITLFDALVWPVEVRWLFRVAIIVSGLIVILTLKFDAPPEVVKEDAPLILQRRKDDVFKPESGSG